MRRLGLILMLAFGLLAPAARAADPILLWHLDTSAQGQPDSSGNNHPGFTQAVDFIQTPRFGAGAFRLGYPGTGSHIGAFFGLPFETPAMSAMLWVRSDGPPGPGHLLSYGRELSSCDPESWGLSVGGGAGAVAATVRGATGNVAGASIPGASLWDGDWHGIAITYGAAAGLRTYVDGAEVGTAAAGKGAIQYPAYDGPSPNWTGFNVGAYDVCGDTDAPAVDVDEARFYDSAISQSDAEYLTNRFHIVAPTGATAPDTEIAARYPLSQSYDTNQVLDGSGHGAHGRNLTGDVVGGRFGNGLALAAPGDGFDIRSSVFEPAQVTVIAWVKRGSAPLNAGIAGVGSDASCQSIYGLETDGTGAVRFRLAGTNGAGTQHSTFLTPPAPAASVWDGGWHAVAGVFRGTEVTLWLDGAFVGATPVTPGRDTIDFGLATNGRGFHVGRGVGSCNANGFAGMVDEVSVYRRGLADDEVSHLTTGTDPVSPPTLPPPEPPAPAEPEPGLVLKWHLDKVNGPSVTDTSGNDFRGTTTRVAPVSPARFKGGLTVQAPDGGGATPGVGHQSENKLQPANVTVLLWARSSTPSATAVIATKGTTGTSCLPGAYGLLGTDKAEFVMRGASGIARSPAASGVWDGQWHMLAGSYDGSKLRLYVDGAQVGDGTSYLDGIRYDLNPGDFRVGGPAASGCPASSTFAGDLDEARVYNRALTEGEIAYLAAGFHRTAPRLPEPAGPKNTRRPGVYGSPAVGQVLACDPGDWNPADVTRQYLWERAPRSTKVEGDSAWVTIDGAAEQGYQVRPEDAGGRVRCREIATKDGVSAEALSFNTKRTDNGPPSAQSAPVMTPLPAVAGKELTCDHGTWDNTSEESDFTYFWVRDGETIGTARTYTPKPLHPPGLGGIGTDPSGDSDHDITCVAQATNDVGEGGRSSAPTFVIEGKPNLKNSPIALLPPAPDGNPLKQVAECSTGDWFDDYAAHPDTAPPGGGYRYQWYRPAADSGATGEVPIAGATGAKLPITPELLGRSIRCGVIASNALGDSPEAKSKEVFVPLPAAIQTGSIDESFRDNEFDPVNLLAASDNYRENIKILARDRVTTAVNGFAKACPTVPMTDGDVKDVYASPPAALDPTNLKHLRTVCALIQSKSADFKRYINGLFWDPGNRSGTCARPASCRPILLTVPSVDEKSAPSLSAAEEAALAPDTPVVILWDVDGDNRTDIACPGSSPAIRAHLNAGVYEPQAILVMTDSATTGRYVRAQTRAYNAQGQHLMYFPNVNKGRGKGSYRKPQPLWCRNTIIPPPDPATGPCVSAGNVGQVLLEGNLCPVNVRGVEQTQIDALSPALRAVVGQAAKEINQREAAYKLLEKGASGGLRFANLRGGAFRSTAQGNVAAAAQNYAGVEANLEAAKVQSNLESQLQDRMKTLADPPKGSDLPKVDIDLPKTSFALDQIYAVNGPLKLNGAVITPGGSLKTIVAPSDVREALTGTARKMTVAATNAALEVGKRQLTEFKDGVQTQIDDAIGGADKLIKDKINLEALDPKKMNLGPFSLVGLDAKVKINPDQTVTLSAVAKLPGLSMSAPGGKKTDAKIAVDLKAGLDGEFKLQGLKIELGLAYLFGINLRDFKLTYNSQRLEASGKITFDALGGSGIDIVRFAINNSGALEALEVNYLAGAGQGITVGPGVFLTKVGGGFQAPDPIELKGTAALSMLAPSAGNGCPTVGAEAGLTFHASPRPITLHTDGTVQLVCIPLGKVTFDVSEAGTADLTAHGDITVPDIVSINADLGGHVRTRNPEAWQIDGKGQVDFKFLPKPIGLKGVFSNKGIAACASVTIPIPWPFDDLNLAAGAAVRFPGGVPPITLPQLIANFRAFTGCDLGEYTPLHAIRVGRALNAPQTFPLDAEPVALSFEGAGAAPKVTLVSPDGQRLDFTDAIEGKFLKDSFGAVMEAEDRSVVMLRKPARGMWTVETADGSGAIVRIQSAPVLPKPTVRAKVSGKGTKRVLKYYVKRIAGQVVSLVEEADGGMKVLRTVKGGGRGKVRFTVGEARSSKRTIAAQVTQDDMPRARLAVARYVAPNPAVGRPRVKIRRTGSTAKVRWSKAALAVRYGVTVRYSDGRTDAFMQPAKARSVTVPAVGRKGGITAYVTAYSAASRHGKTGTGRLKQVKPKKKAAKKRKGKRRKHRRK